MSISPQKIALLQRRLKIKENGLSLIPKMPRQEGVTEFPLSFAQQRLWFLDHMDPGNITYTMPGAARLLGPLDLEALERSVNEIVSRHEVLRTRFVLVEGEPAQQVLPACYFPLPVYDLSQSENQQQEIQRLMAEEVEQPFDLSQGPLLRMRVLRLSPEEHIVLTNQHHSISDGWSVDLFNRELSLLYRAYHAGEDSPLPPLPIQYADYAYWQRQWLQGAVLEQQLSYWKDHLRGVPAAMDLPTDRPRPPVQSFRGADYGVEFSRELLEGLKQLSREQGVTLFMTLFASFTALLALLSRQEDIVVGTPIANRGRAELEALIGLFVNTLALRCNLQGNPTFQELLQRVKGVALEAYSHQDVPFEQVVEALQLPRDLSRSPLFQVMFSLQIHNGISTTAEFPGLDIEPMQIGNQTTKFDLSLHLEVSPTGITGAFEYNTDLFDESTIARMKEQYEVLLADIVEHPERHISDLHILPEAQEQQVLQGWNITQKSFPENTCIHQLFERQVEQTPDAVAVTFEGAFLTYAALNARANQIAHALRTLGVQPEDIVGLYIDRSLEQVLGMLGILKAGGAYLPLDPNYPSERLAFMLHNAQVPVLLTVQQLLEAVPADYHGQRVCLNEPGAGWQQMPCSNTRNRSHPLNLAYVIYTSGSTGQPKGVMVSHRGLCNHMHWMQTAYPLTSTDRVLQKTPFSFDASVWEFYAPLLAGAGLVIARPGGHQEPLYLIKSVVREQITILQLVPTLLSNLLQEPEIKACTSLRYVFCGGEELSSDLQARFFATLSADLCNLYGPTETTIQTITWTCERGSEQQRVPIGHPIFNTQAYLLDTYLQPVPIGTAGELYIGGQGVTRGYLYQPALTAERFVPDPFSVSEPGGRLYRTGDQARYRPDGCIEYLGRLDHQVKLRGYRIELGEIESAIGTHPQVTACVVLLRATSSGDTQLVAYVATKDASLLASSDLRSLLAERLPLYMVPSAFVLLEALPLTPNGKLDRQALLALPLPREAGRDHLQGPRTPMEELVTGIWSQLLDREQIDRTDNFFALGGHSLLIMQLASRVRESLQVELPLRRFFEHPTIESLARAIEQAQQEHEQLHLPPLLPVSREQVLPLSFAQQRLWFLEQLEPGNTAYSMPGAARLRGPLDLQALGHSFAEIVSRHEVLRTRLVLVGEEPAQQVLPAGSFSLSLHDLSQSENQQQEIQRFITEEVQQPFDLSRGPLLRVKVLRLSPEEHIVLTNQHHSISDGWSADLFNRELSVLYRAYHAGEDSPLPPLPIQYADYAHWQRQWLQGAVLERQLSYWKEHLRGAPDALALPTDRPRPPVQSFRGASHDIELSSQQVEGLKYLSREQGVTLFMTLFASFAALLARLSGQEDIVVGTPIANRGRAELETLIGLFVNTLALRCNLQGNPTFQELLQRVKEVALGAYSHQDVPFEQVVEALQLPRDLSRSPLVQVMFSLQVQNGMAATAEFPDLSIESMQIGNQTTKFDLSLHLEASPAGIAGTFEYNTDLFDEATVSRIKEQYQVFLTAIVEHPERHLSDLYILPEAQEQQVLRGWNDTRKSFPENACIHQLFERQVEQTPDAVAVTCEGAFLTYAALNARANQIALTLRTLGVRPEEIVGLYLERSLEQVVGMLAILKAGGAYLPLDPHYPSERLALMLHQAQVSVLLTVQQWQEAVPAAYHGQRLCLDEPGAGWHHLPCSNMLTRSHPLNLAYVICTSGSTGQPKGVMVSHRNLCNHMHWMQAAYPLRRTDRVLQKTPFSFDASVWEFYAPLLAGALLVIARPGGHQDPAYLIKTVVREQVTILQLVPTMLSHLLQEPGIKTCSSLRSVFCGGEELSSDLQARFFATVSAALCNLYGPTETTIQTVTWTCEPGSERQRVPIGRPIFNTRVYLLDRYLHPVPLGVAGEVYIGGQAVTRGYLNQPALTAERFVPDPFSDDAGGRLYRTGDQARYRPDGNIEFLGRLDHQVKLRGYRIELGEIESLLRQHSLVQDCVVMVREEKSGNKRLVAYVVPRQNQEQDLLKHGLRSMLQQHLPPYMVPSAFLYLEALPLTPNGKVDLRALSTLRIQEQDGDASKNDAAPRDRVELQLVHIWEDLMQVRPVNITDDFFELGGHSLLAVRLMAHIQHAFQQNLPLSALFQGATIEHLASLLRQQRADHVYSPLVPIQKASGQHPFFCVHPIGGEVLCYLDLARALGPEQPVYALQAAGLYGEHSPFHSIEEMAEQYIQALRAVQPDGPYYLGGWSMGGVIAFEMARRLQEQGEEIALLALLDSYAPSPSLYENDHPDREVIEFIEDLASLSGIKEQIPWPLLEQLSPDEQLEHLMGHMVRAQLLPDSSGLDSLRSRLQVFQANKQALRSYRPQAYAGHLHLIRASEEVAEVEQDHTLGWHEVVAGGINLQILPGNHYTLVQKPAVQALAEHLRTYLS